MSKKTKRWPRTRAMLRRLFRWKSKPTEQKPRHLLRIPASHHLSRYYDAADINRRDGGWHDVRGGGDAPAATCELERVRNLARKLTRNSDHAFAGVSALVNNLVGDGIRPQSNTGDEALDERVDELWQAWQEFASSDGQLDAYGIQLLAARSLARDGEVLLRQYTRRETDGLPIRMQVEVLESDYLDHTDTRNLSGRAKVVQGVEFNGRGQRVAYWLRTEHPGSSLWSGTTGTRRVRANRISHCYEPLRAGQVRGMSWLAPVAVRLMMLSDYTDAELSRKRNESCHWATVEGFEGDNFAIQPDGDEDGQGPPLAVSADGVPFEEIEADLVVYAPPGATIKHHAPASIGGVAEYRKQELIAIASGLRMCYVILTGDLSGTNYSSIKAGLIEFRRFMRAIRGTVFIRQICRPLWRWPISIAVDQGLLPPVWESGPRAGQPIVYKVRWSPPRFESIDVLKDAQADALNLANMLVGYGDIIRRRGDLPEDVIADLERWAEKLREAGFEPPWLANAEADDEGDEMPPPPDEDASEEEQQAQERRLTDWLLRRLRKRSRKSDA